MTGHISTVQTAIEAVLLTYSAWRMTMAVNRLQKMLVNEEVGGNGQRVASAKELMLVAFERNFAGHMLDGSHGLRGS